METSIEQIVKEWLSKPFLKKYSEIGKDWLAKQKEKANGSFERKQGVYS